LIAQREMVYNSLAGGHAVTYGTALLCIERPSVSGRIILIQVTYYGVHGGEEVKDVEMSRMCIYKNSLNAIEGNSICRTKK
jgi:hypothetical protein